MILFDFLTWHYFKGTKTVFKAWGNFISLAFHLFSVPLLIRTLFSPWRRVEIQKNTSGFSFNKFFEQLTFNLISRLIGFLVRSMIIFWGFLFSLFFFVLGFLLIIAWPFLLPLTFLIYLLIREKKQSDEQLIKGEALYQMVQGKPKKFILARLGLENSIQFKNIPSEDIKAVLTWYQKNKTLQAQKWHFWEKKNLFKLPSFGSDLAFGYTLDLDKYCDDLSFPPSFAHQLVGREKEIRQIEAVLGRSAESNIILSGEPGSGKHTILLGLAKAIREKRVIPSLFYKRVLLLNMNLILGANALVDGKAKFEQLLREAEKAGNIILVINQLEKYVNQEIGMDLTNVITQLAGSKRLQLVGVTTPSNFEQYIFPNTQLTKFFERVEVIPPAKEEALEILETILPDFEKGKKVITTYQALKEIIDQSDSLITNIPFPEKAIDLLDRLIGEAVNKGQKIITKEDVDNLISIKLKVPLGSLSQRETEKLKSLELTLKKRLIGQSPAVLSLVKALQRSRVGLTRKDKPIGTFLFLGPTGVGKTETAKALAEAYFGNEKLMVRFDMAQPLNLPLFYEQTREHPFSVLLLDEFEKAKPETLNLFLPVFDEGYLKDDHGTIISFKNMIIIATSNAGAEFIREKLKNEPGISQEQFQMQLTEHVLQKGIFSPELLNRFDSVVIYKPLTLEEFNKIAAINLGIFINQLKEKGIVLIVEPQVYPVLASLGFSFEFGARPLRRLIADTIESLAAQKILNNEIKEGDKIKLTVDPISKEFKIEITKSQIPISKLFVIWCL